MLLGSLARYEKALGLSDEDFKQVIGVKKRPLRLWLRS